MCASQILKDPHNIARFFRMLKAILFDLDDTLIDWSMFAQNWEEVEGQHLPGVYEYFCSLGVPNCDFEGFAQLFRERTREAWTSARTTLIAPHLGRVLRESAAALDIPVDKFEERTCLELYKWGAVKGTGVFPDVIEALTLLRDQGLKFGLVTNAFQPMWMRDAEMTEHGLIDFFPSCRFSAADVGCLKPHPDIFLKALGCLGTSPDETIFVGDNPVADIAGAQSAGMRAVMRVNHTFAPMLSGLIIPDAAINSLLELPAVLDEWFPGWGV